MAEVSNCYSCRLCGLAVLKTEEKVISGFRVCKKCYKFVFKYKKFLRGKGFIETIDK